MKRCALACFDVETTGVGQTDDIVQFSCVLMVPSWVKPQVFTSLANPCRPIPKEAFEVHGIADDDVQSWPSPKAVVEEWKAWLYEAVEDFPVVFAGHNTRFDQRMVRRYDPFFWPRHSIDTLTVFRRDDPLAVNHKLETLAQSYLPGREFQFHDATADCWVVYEFLERVCQEDGKSLLTLAGYSRTPMTIEVMPFGKHKGRQITSLDPGYLRYLSAQPEMDQDVLHTAKTVLRTMGVLLSE